MADKLDLVAHMRPVLAAERDLRELGVVWQMIESSAAIGCPDEADALLTTLTETRSRFDQLQHRLVEQMVDENRAQLGEDLGAKAQCAIDILVRNLYERTADVGFLATDAAVRDFCAAGADERAQCLPATLGRLAEYQAKYSVYDDIALLSPAGDVLARLDTQAPALPPQAELAAQALCGRGYLEHFDRSGLGADPAVPALLYAHRVAAADGRAAGVLVLRFRFADEMSRIFDGVVDDPHRVVMTLVDASHRVIASSDPAHIPIGARLPALAGGQATLTSFAGREYMASCCASHGYQGYAGPPWRAVAMVSLLTAFRNRADGDRADVPLDNPQLVAVQQEADAINRDLRRVLWNGSVLIARDSRTGSAGSRLKAVLRQVALTGRRTRARVNQAIHDIYRVALARSRHQARELARLAADIMDRNLYERANDCRWWALSPLLRSTLADPPGDAGSQALQALLAHINGLYTVYSQLVAFDAQGVIRAVSVAEDNPRWQGAAVPANWLEAVRSLSGTQAYAVTPFETTDLHAHGPTYVYLAAVQAPDDRSFAGGIAIVFHSARELGAMLHDIIGERAGFAAFVDDQGRVLAASDPDLAQGDVLHFDGEAAVVEHGGRHFACARARAPGYREFKRADGYDNHVQAIVGLRLGASERRRSHFSDVDLEPAGVTLHPADAVEMAVFQVGALRYALPAAVIVEARGADAIVRTPTLHPAMVGMIDLGAAAGGDAPLVRVSCARRHFGVDYPARQSDGVVLFIVGPDGRTDHCVGLRVDDVLCVIEVAEDGIHPAPAGMRGLSSNWVDGLIDCTEQGPGGSKPVLVQRLSAAQLWADLGGAAAIATDAVPLADDAAGAGVNPGRPAATFP